MIRSIIVIIVVGFVLYNVHDKATAYTHLISDLDLIYLLVI